MLVHVAPLVLSDAHCDTTAIDPVVCCAGLHSCITAMVLRRQCQGQTWQLNGCQSASLQMLTALVLTPLSQDAVTSLLCMSPSVNLPLQQYFADTTYCQDEIYGLCQVVLECFQGDFSGAQSVKLCCLVI